MEPTLTPHLALAYLRELSTDVRGGIVLDAGSTRLAGDSRLEPGSRALVAAMAGGEWMQLRLSEGWVFAATFPGGALVLVTGPHALAGLVRHDVRAAVDMLAGAGRRAGPRESLPLPAPSRPAGEAGTAAAASGDALARLAEGLHAALSPVGERLTPDR